MGKFGRGQPGTRTPGAMSLTMAACIHTAVTSLTSVLTADATSAPQPPRRPRWDRCGLATYYLHECLILFSQQLFEEGSVIHTHFTGEETKPQSSHVTFPKSPGKTQALHPGRHGPVFCSFDPLRHGPLISAATLRRHVEGPESLPSGSPLWSAHLFRPCF